jgi:hypothetical protein
MCLNFLIKKFNEKKKRKLEHDKNENNLTITPNEKLEILRMQKA